MKAAIATLLALAFGSLAHAQTGVTTPGTTDPFAPAEPGVAPRAASPAPAVSPPPAVSPGVTPGAALGRSEIAAPGSTPIGLRVGMTTVEDLDGPVATVGAFTDFALDRDLHLGVGVDYWARDDARLRDLRVQVSDVAISAHTRFIFSEVAIPVKPFVLGGLAAHVLQIRVAEEAAPSGAAIERFREVESDATTKLAVELAGGALYQVQERMSVTGELRFRRLVDTTVDFDQVLLAGGLVYSL